MALYYSNSEKEDDPMVSGSVNPLAAKVEIIASRSGARDGKSTHRLVLYLMPD